MYEKILQGVQMLHAYNFIHTEINPYNIFMYLGKDH